MLEGVTVVYRSNVDLFFYVVGSQTENEVCGIYIHVMYFGKLQLPLKFETPLFFIR